MGNKPQYLFITKELIVTYQLLWDFTLPLW